MTSLPIIATTLLLKRGFGQVAKVRVLRTPQNQPALQPTLEDDLALMRRIDELHLEHPFAGSRMLRDLLNREGNAVGRKHVATLMRRMGIASIRCSRTSFESKKTMS